MAESEQEKNRVLLAMVALNRPSMPPAGALLAGLRAVPDIDLDLGSLKESDGKIVFGLGGDHAAAALMPEPIPWSALEGPCATAWWWPEASEKMKSHTSHILVALAGETSTWCSGTTPRTYGGHRRTYRRQGNDKANARPRTGRCSSNR